jgi:hypothetical protein
LFVFAGPASTYNERVRTRWPTAPELAAQVDAALSLISATPGYETVARDLERLARRGGIRFHPTMTDRAHAGLLGAITLGPETLAGSALSLAETLVHEHYHLRRQSHFAKTASFWQGVFTRTPVMARYERPAYESALAFLHAVARTFPDLADEAQGEATAVMETYAAHYGKVRAT